MGELSVDAEKFRRWVTGERSYVLKELGEEIQLTFEPTFPDAQYHLRGRTVFTIHGRRLEDRIVLYWMTIDDDEGVRDGDLAALEGWLEDIENGP